MTLVKRCGSLLLAVSLLVGGGTGIAAAQDDVYLPQVTSPNGDVGDFNVEYTVSAEAKAAAMNFSSAATRAAVPPLEWNGEVREQVDDAPAELGEVRWSNGGLPEPDADNVAKANYADAWAAIDEAELAAAVEELEAAGSNFDDPGDDYTGSTHVSIRGNAYGKMWNAYPYRAVGRLYLYEDEGGTLVSAGYCSASVMGSLNLIVTAAHCVYDQDDLSDPWYDAWEFVPADRNGAAPFGSWWANNAIVRGPWTSGGGRNYDVSLLSLDYKYIDSVWRPVSYYTGWLGRVWNLGYQQQLFSIGYPSNLDSGIYSYLCVAESYYGGATDYISKGCNMTFGASGGPWIYKFHPYRAWNYNYVNSVVSGGVPGSNVFTGPRFSDDNIGSLCTDWLCGADWPQQ